MQCEGNIFRILGLYGKEVVVSNMLAWLIDPKEDHNLGIDITNDFLASMGCSCMDENNDIIIHREYYGRKNKKNNFIDLFKIIGRERINRMDIQKLLLLHKKRAIQIKVILMTFMITDLQII